ncbi:signal transduction histidine kinase, LytS [Desulfitobacterium hafniense DCB-2]|uniref:Histidine kinase n=6 Tax=root TaxID=1 RepID=A0A098AXJ1_DESHA|nr:histidine kinase [Desulfitobacterium hafniense]ACL20480.1 signal transduction histidine kinase, LytS [Desulfitobacterium hafniense DCB-2]EHL04327.1 ATPase/histidine kinase/DNA gyrase B/HSP90 domain protein [Desulfitobacterium hafniense DP7]KTE92364.1 histidine kinase [Desulfitobacterium hafniense]CDX01333.1 ATPase/histidine kinase/DNA gyrase B/HSP90 domain protein [Desulfitobacterium hafniense]
MLKRAVMHRDAAYKIKTPMDSIKWCRYIVNIGYICVALMAFAHVAWYFGARDYLVNPPDIYLKYFIIAPTIGTCALNLLADLLVRSARVPIQAKEYLCSFILVIYSFYLIMAHEIAVVLLCTFMLSIFISAIFSKVKITRWVFLASMLSLMLFGVKMYVTGNMDSRMVMQIFITCLMFVGSYLMAKMLIQHYHDNFAAITSSHEEAAKNELAFLQAQIKPHFLYNAINTMVSFCHTDSERAASLLINFSKYLRLVFDVDHKSMLVSLEREIELIKAYVAIEKARFGGQISIEYTIEPELLSMEIPSFCLQPLVENAIKHGLCKKAAGGTVLISAQKSEGTIIIKISDTGIGMGAEQLNKLKNSESSKEGVGFFNVSRRVKSWQDAQLDIQSTEGGGTTVTITLSDIIA